MLANLASVPAADLREYALKEFLKPDNTFPAADYEAFLDADPCPLDQGDKKHLDTPGRIMYSLLAHEGAVVQSCRLDAPSVLLWQL